jgi:two-component system, NtrC family, response regulator AlgB
MIPSLLEQSTNEMSEPEHNWSALVVDDDPGVRQSVRLCLEADGARVLGVGSSAAALDALDRGQYDVVFLDLWLNAESGLDALPEIIRRQPGIGVIVITAHASFETAVEAMRLGAVDYLPKMFTPEQVRHAARRVVSAGVLKRQLSELKDRLDETTEDGFFETYSPLCRSFFETATRAAASDAVILLRGESGTGKTVFARWLRRHSRRGDGPFVTVHCPMLSSELMASALFGHRKGAFTGAVSDVVGKVEEAKGGTLFLDEVADLSADAQARLLRFLNDRTYERVGEATERKADVRLIVATNRSLEEEVQAGRFGKTCCTD